MVLNIINNLPTNSLRRILFVESLEPSSLENVLSSKVDHNASTSAIAYRQCNEQPYGEHISQIAKLRDTNNNSTLSTNLVERGSECDVVNKVNYGIVKKSTSLSTSTSDGMVKNQIKCLTEEVHFLKQLFTNKEVRLQFFLYSYIILRHL